MKQKNKNDALGLSSNKKVMEILIFIPKFPCKVLCRHKLRGCLPKISTPFWTMSRISLKLCKRFTLQQGSFKIHLILPLRSFCPFSRGVQLKKKLGKRTVSGSRRDNCFLSENLASSTSRLEFVTTPRGNTGVCMLYGS